MVRPIFCAGLTELELSTRYIRFLNSNEPAIMAAGDDTLVKLNNNMFEEDDFSMYDQSQDDGPLKDTMLYWLSILGVQHDMWFEWYHSFASGYKAKKRNSVTSLLIKGNPGTQMATGSTLTTVINTVNAILAKIYRISQSHRTSPEVHLDLGFNVKNKCFDTPFEMTFLKGWWGIDDEKYYWFPLPSLCLKIGKIINDPTVIAKAKSRRESIQLVAHAISCCIKVPPDYPILGPFVMALRRCGMISKNEIAPETMIEDYSYKMWTGLTYDRPCSALLLDHLMQMTCARYRIDIEDITRVHRKFDSITSIPTFVCDEVFLRLRDVDYS